MEQYENKMLLALREYVLSLPLKPKQDEWYEFSVKLKYIGDSFKFVGEELIATKDKNSSLTPIGEEIEELIKIKDNAYAERNKVIAAFAHHLSNTPYQCRVYRAYHEDPDWEGDWRTILVIEKGDLQMTWHFHDSEKYLLERLPTANLYKWDGHDTKEKYNRLVNIFIKE